MHSVHHNEKSIFDRGRLKLGILINLLVLRLFQIMNAITYRLVTPPKTSQLKLAGTKRRPQKSATKTLINSMYEHNPRPSPGSPQFHSAEQLVESGYTPRRWNWQETATPTICCVGVQTVEGRGERGENQSRTTAGKLVFTHPVAHN